MDQQIRFDLNEEELAALKQMLGRELNELELAMVDAEWSEHCSYKSSRQVLRQLPTTGPRVILGPGFDAGAVNVGEGWVVTLHIESHNHPSAIDPYGGAATGVGGILRDILSVGTRPIALLNSLRFGCIERSADSRWLFRNVVRGISDYANCVGVPTVAGEVEFDSCFERNCLVTVACVGLGRREDLILPLAKHPGDSVILVGGRTGRDGIHGSTFASRVLSDESDKERSAVQIPDPFTKKLIIEATLEALRTGRVRGLKDLGGGGLACALSEMADRGGRGVEVELSKVPLREEGLEPFEVMISESQERMVFIVEGGFEDEVCRVFEKYELPCSTIGRIGSHGNLVIKKEGLELASIPARVVANSPTFQRSSIRPSYMDGLREVRKPPPPEDLSSVLLKLLSSPNVASRRWVYEQYDHEVGIRTVVKPGQGDASVLRMPNGKFLAVKVDGNPKHCYLDPYHGAAGCVAEACRNVIAVGGEPIAMVDHCQFGNPGSPEVYWAFKEAVKGMADCCRALSLPCIGGKVSFYNEDRSTGVAIKPSPVVAVVGLVQDRSHIRTMKLEGSSSRIIIIGKTLEEMGGSEYYEFFHKLTGGVPPKVNFDLERRSHEAVKEGIRRGLLDSVHDCSKGGLAVALAEMCIAGGMGAEVDLAKVPSECERLDETLFSESNARFIVTTSEERVQRLLTLVRGLGVDGRECGRVGGKSLVFLEGSSEVLSARVTKMASAWSEAIPRYMGEMA